MKKQIESIGFDYNTWEVPAGCYSATIEVSHGELLKCDKVVLAVNTSAIVRRNIELSPGQIIRYRSYGDVGYVLIDWTGKEYRSIEEPFEISKDQNESICSN